MGLKMDYQSLVDYLMSKKCATKDMPFDIETLCFRVMKKIFALMAWQEEPIVISLKCDPAEAIMLRQTYPGITPGYHMNKKHWNTVVIDDRIPEFEIKRMIDVSYDLVVKGLSKEEKQLFNRSASDDRSA
jgi:predicted DNA-binding protein (MmcQ/YjbR family)